MSVFKTSLKKDALQELKLVKVDVNDKSLVLTNIKGKLYAMDAVYSHKGGPLEEGTLEGYSRHFFKIRSKSKFYRLGVHEYQRQICIKRFTKKKMDDKCLKHS